ncbi:MAG: hypothetical protein ACRCXY_03460 [Fusobacteriaceae bacterium]
MKIKYIGSKVIVEFKVNNVNKILEGAPSEVWSQVSTLTGIKY